MALNEQTARREALGIPSPPHPEEMKAMVELRIGDRAAIMATARTTPAGLISIGLMVGAILLSTAALVHAARRKL